MGFRRITCTCGKVMAACEHKKHLKTACEDRVVPCRHKRCIMRIKFRDRERHELTECNHRWISCSFVDVARETVLDTSVSQIEGVGDLPPLCPRAETPVADGMIRIV